MGHTIFEVIKSGVKEQLNLLVASYDHQGLVGDEHLFHALHFEQAFVGDPIGLIVVKCHPMQSRNQGVYRFLHSSYLLVNTFSFVQHLI